MMTLVMRRAVGLLVAIGLTAGLLTSCRTNVGVAARVGGAQISENKVSDYVLASGPSATPSASASSTTQSAKVVVVNYLVLREVFRRTLASTGDVPSDTELRASRSAAVRLLLNASLSNDALLKSLDRQLADIGVKSSLADVFLTVEELEYAIVQRVHATAVSDVVAAVRKANVTVRINPRFGSWVPSQLAVNGDGGQPAYLQLQSTLAPTGS